MRSFRAFCGLRRAVVSSSLQYGGCLSGSKSLSSLHPSPVGAAVPKDQLSQPQSLGPARTEIDSKLLHVAIADLQFRRTGELWEAFVAHRTSFTRETPWTTYRVFLAAFLGAGQLERAYEVLYFLADELGLYLKPSVYNALLGKCVKARNVSLAMDVFSLFLSKQGKITEISHSILSCDSPPQTFSPDAAPTTTNVGSPKADTCAFPDLDFGFLEQEDVSSLSKEIYDEILDSIPEAPSPMDQLGDIRISPTRCISLFRQFFHENKRGVRYHPNNLTFMYILSALYVEGQFAQFPFLLDCAIANLGATMSENAISIFLEGLNATGDEASIIKLLSFILENSDGMKLRPTMLLRCVRVLQKKSDASWSLLLQIMETTEPRVWKTFAGSEVLNRMLCNLCETGMANQAIAFIQQRLDKGQVFLSAHLCSSLILACNRSRDFERAQHFFDTFLRKTIRSHAVPETFDHETDPVDSSFSSTGNEFIEQVKRRVAQYEQNSHRSASPRSAAPTGEGSPEVTAQADSCDLWLPLTSASEVDLANKLLVQLPNLVSTDRPPTEGKRVDHPLEHLLVSLMFVYASAGHAGVFKVFSELQRYGFQPDQRSLTCLVRACWNSLLIEKWKKIALRKGIDPATLPLSKGYEHIPQPFKHAAEIIFLFQTQYKVQAGDEALSHIAKMKDAGFVDALDKKLSSNGIRRSLRFHSSFMDVLRFSGQFEKAYARFDALIQSGTRLNNTIFASMLAACKAAGDKHRFALTFEIMCSQNYPMSVFLFNVVVTGFAQFGDFSKAVELLQQALSRGQDISNQLLDHLLAQCVRHDQPQIAITIIESMLSEGRSLVPNTVRGFVFSVTVWAQTERMLHDVGRSDLADLARRAFSVDQRPSRLADTPSH